MSKYTLEKIRTLPESLLDRYYDPDLNDRYENEILPALEAEEQRALKDLVLDVYFKELTPNAFVSALREAVADDAAYQETLIKVLGHDFLPIADELGADVLELIKNNGGDPLLFRSKVPVSDVVDQIKKKIASDIPQDERMAHRLENILKSKVTNARTDAQVEEMLTGNPKTSGVGMAKDKASAIMLFTNEEMKKLEQRNVVVESDEEYEREVAAKEAAEEVDEEQGASDQGGEDRGGEDAAVEQGGEASEDRPVETLKEEEPKQQIDAFSAEDKEEIAEIAEELGPTKKTMAQKAVEFTIETLADEALDASGMPFDEDMHKRFRYAVDLFHRDLRDELETRSKLTMDVKSGGMGLNDEQAEKVMALLKTRIGEYRTFMSAKSAAEKEKYVADRAARESGRADEEERRKRAALDRKFRELTGKEAPLPDAASSDAAIPQPSMPKRVAVVTEEIVEPPAAPAIEDLLDAGTKAMTSPSDAEGVTKTAEPPAALPVAGGAMDDKNADLEALRKDMEEPSEEQLLAGSAVGAVSAGGYRDRPAERKVPTAQGTAVPASSLQSPVQPPAPKPVPKPIIASPRPSPVPPASMPAMVPRAATPPPAGKAVVSDIKFTPKLTGPVEELRQLTLIDFRRLSKDPKEATLKIKDKLDLLEQQSYELKQEGVKAWQESPANKAYLDVLKESLEGKPVADVLKARQADKNGLLRPEFEALMELNRVIRFG